MCSLYAPNGTLKTSLAKVLKDIEEDRQSKDIIFPERATKRLVTLDGQPVDAGQIMVINSYDESYSSKQVSTLLVIRPCFAWITARNLSLWRWLNGQRNMQ